MWVCGRALRATAAHSRKAPEKALLMALAKASRFLDVESTLKKRVIDLFRSCCRNAKDAGVSPISPSYRNAGIERL